jgi:hypothetical protein
MFSIVVIAVAIGVFAMYFRHDRQIRRNRRAELARAAEPPPSGAPSPDPATSDRAADPSSDPSSADRS